jgi:hypothetical protein
LNNRKQFDQLANEIVNLQEHHEKEIKRLAAEHEEALEQIRNAYSKKMLADAAKYKELQE